MPETSGTIGTRRDLKVRLGDTLRPQVLTVRLKAGVLDSGGAQVLARLYRGEADITPLPSPTFDVVHLTPTPAGEPRYRLTLDKDKVTALAMLGLATRGAKTRTFFWTCSFVDSVGTSHPLYYGQLIIYLGATGG